MSADVVTVVAVLVLAAPWIMCAWTCVWNVLVDWR